MLAPDGCDARDQLCHEATVLEHLAGDARFPAPLALAASDDDLYLVMTEVAEENLEQYMARRHGPGQPLDARRWVAWGLELAALLETIHARGWVYCDLKAGNVMVTADEHLRLIDFGAMGAVFEARHAKDDRAKFAVKVLDPELASRDRRYVERFVR